MARKRGKGKGGRRFVRDAIGRFARTAAEATGRVAKEAFKEAEAELTDVAKQAAKDGVAAAAAELKRARENWKLMRRTSKPDPDDYTEAHTDLNNAIKKLAKAKAKLGGL